MALVHQWRRLFIHFIQRKTCVVKKNFAQDTADWENVWKMKDINVITSGPWKHLIAKKMALVVWSIRHINMQPGYTAFLTSQRPPIVHLRLKKIWKKTRMWSRHGIPGNNGPKRNKTTTHYSTKNSNLIVALASDLMEKHHLDSVVFKWKLSSRHHIHWF